MEVGKMVQVKEDVMALFFLTQQRIVDKAECRTILNAIRKGIGLDSEISEEEFVRNFSAPATSPAGAPSKEIPQGNVTHDGQHHEVKVKVPEGQHQVIEAKKVN